MLVLDLRSDMFISLSDNIPLIIYTSTRLQSWTVHEHVHTHDSIKSENRYTSTTAGAVPQKTIKVINRCNYICTQSP